MAGYEHKPAFDGGYLPVSDLHTMHYEQYGNPDGKPVLYLHGGPGGHTSKADAAFFDPTILRAVLYDQRGTGKSTPSCELRENTTANLVADIEALRTHLSIPKWHAVFGGSWGSTLALVYAQTHPQNVGSLVLRGIFLVRDAEIAWSRPSQPGCGSARLFPDIHEEVMAYLPEADRTDFVDGYHKLLTADDRPTRIAAARMTNKWDLSHGSLVVDDTVYDKIEDEKWSLEHAIIETHYVKHRAWLEEGQILKEENMAKIRGIPATIVQGRYDVVCPPQSAWDLHRAWPGSRLVMVPNAGHSAREPGIFRALVDACDDLARVDF